MRYDTQGVQRSWAPRIGRRSVRAGGSARTNIGSGRHLLAFVIELLLLVLLGFTVGFHPVVTFRDLTCGAGSQARYVSVSRGAIRCEPNPAAVEATTVPSSRYIGLFLTNIGVRVFEVDFLAGSVEGPG